jgi:hypothetical protein
MPVLSLVHPWPAQLRADRPSDDDPVADVAIRACRSVAALYSEALADVAIPHRTTELRLFTAHHPERHDVRGSVHVDPRSEGWESGFVIVPTSFADRTPGARAEALLAAVHGIVVRLGEARGWDRSLLERCRRHVVDRAFEFRWSSPPKTSPDRRHEARAHFRLTPDGYGRARLVVSRKDDGAEVAATDEALAYCTREGFLRAAASLTWEGKDHVSLVPYDGVPAVRGGEVSLSREDEAWVGTAVDLMRVRPVPDGDASLPPLEVSVVGRGVTADEDPPRIDFVGGGPIQTRAISQFHTLLGQDMARLQSPAGHSWWAGSGLRLLEIQVRYQTARTHVRGRVTGQRLGVFVDVSDESLAERDHEPLSREITEAVLMLARRRTGLGPHPEQAR